MHLPVVRNALLVCLVGGATALGVDRAVHVGSSLLGSLAAVPDSSATITQAGILPSWPGGLPLLLLGMLIGFAIARARSVRRRGNAFVIMRGRVQCPECEYLLDLDDRHCAQCGTAIVQIKRRLPCPRCRARNWEDDKFCRQCGVAAENSGESDVSSAESESTSG